MLELCPVSIGIVRINAAISAITEIALSVNDASVWRTSPNEALVLCTEVDEARVLQEIEGQLVRTDPGGVAVADSDSFAAWKLDGYGVELAFSRISAIPLPVQRPALVQGLVADAPMKVLAGQNHLLFLVGSPLSHHFRGRLLEASVPMGIVERESTIFEPPIEVVA